jgi:hypothetical protein
MSTKEIQAKLIDNLKRWQKIEDSSVAQMGEIMANTENPVIRMIMEIIMRDSQNHYKVQELIVRSLQTESMRLDTEEIAKVWGLIDKHIRMEKMADELAKLSLESIKGKKMVIQEFLLKYLTQDEEKHDSMLENLEAIKNGMYPYG